MVFFSLSFFCTLARFIVAICTSIALLRDNEFCHACKRLSIHSLLDICGSVFICVRRTKFHLWSGIRLVFRYVTTCSARKRSRINRSIATEGKTRISERCGSETKRNGVSQRQNQTQKREEDKPNGKKATTIAAGKKREERQHQTKRNYFFAEKTWPHQIWFECNRQTFHIITARYWSIMSTQALMFDKSMTKLR